MILSDWEKLNYILSLSQLLTEEEKDVCSKIKINLEKLNDLEKIITILKEKYNFIFDCDYRGYFVTLTNKNGAEKDAYNEIIFDTEQDYKLFKKIFN